MNDQSSTQNDVEEKQKQNKKRTKKSTIISITTNFGSTASMKTVARSPLPLLGRS
jgi:hypothetical protein